MRLYCLRNKRGTLFPDTLAATRGGVWGCGGFDTVASIEGNEWRVEYWKRWEESKASARRLGYRIVEVSLTEVDK